MIEYGKSASGSTYYTRGGRYYRFNLQPIDLEPIVKRPLPATLAWTEMNTGWKKGKR